MLFKRVRYKSCWDFSSKPETESETGSERKPVFPLIWKNTFCNKEIVDPFQIVWKMFDSKDNTSLV